LAVIAHHNPERILISCLVWTFSFADQFRNMLQVGYFKYTKKRFWEGKRIFLMAPLLINYQKKDTMKENCKTRFWVGLESIWR